jgi:integrase
MSHPAARIFPILAAATGCRRAELCGLQWSDLDGNVLHVRRTITELRGGGVEIGPTKTRSTRRLTLDDATVAALAEHRESMRGLAGSPWILFDGWTDQPVRPIRLSHWWEELRDVVKVSARLHDLRHWHLTQLLDAGVPLASVAQRGGHASGVTTQKIYAHHTQRADEASAAVIGGLLRG